MKIAVVGLGRVFKHYINKLVKKIQRNDNENFIIFESNEKIKFNKIILATHADQSLDILEKPTKNENDIFSAFKIVGEFLDKSILKPNNISFPSSRIEFGKLIKQI